MGIQCPKCSGENVQAIRAILQSGTTFSSGTVTGIGVGDGSGVFVGTTSGTSQTTLASRFSAPKKPSKLEVIGTGVMALASSPWLAANGPDVMWRYMNLAFWAVFAWFVWSYRKKSADYKEKYPKWKALHDNGYYCHRCGTAYIP
ncbi:hypothetical protein E2K99_01995 [Herbaspirillum huttiense]|uniref:hypothetical protein n=1 Tax=Herbaspirillum huttiense TaxID=863372 RepID=UPI0010665510|nr:hypothetical protein [Herbaspirillum huttiense]QBP73855.1 hypothetical protein E2K99_01995 [Herbaspirillum huttiense]